MSEETGRSKKRRKGVLTPENYKRNVIKESRVKGKEYENYKQQKVPLKIMGPACK